MKRVLSFVALTVMVVTAAVYRQARAQSDQNPFRDHSDTGEIVHVLPTPAAIRSPHDTQPTDAPRAPYTAVYAPSYGSGNLIDHGGLEIGNAGFKSIFWNGSVANSTSTSLGYGSIQAQINGFVNSFSSLGNWSGSNTDDYTIVQQYGSKVWISPTLLNAGALVDSRSSQGQISDSKIRSYLTALFNSGVPVSASTIYGVYFPPGMKVTLAGGASCSSFCGYHSHFSYGGTQIKYAVFPYPNCSGCSLAGKSVGDMLTIITSHEIREAVTDPGDFNANAWYDSAGYEADDKCAWHNLYQMTNGGFWVQPEYSNGGTVMASGFLKTYPGPGCVVPNK